MNTLRKFINHFHHAVESKVYLLIEEHTNESYWNRLGGEIV